MARVSKFNNDDTLTVAGTASTLEDVVSLTGSGIVDYLVIRAITNASNIDYYSLEIDGTEYQFKIDLPFSEGFGVLTTPNALMQMNRPLFFDTSFKIQAFFNASVSVDFKFSVLTHEEN